MNRHKRIPVILPLGLLAACSGANPTAYDTFSNESADLVLTGGKIFTVDDDKPWAQAVAIKGEKFVFVGDDAGAAKFISDKTQSIDLGGRLVIPGIVDSHTHPGYMDLEP
jgi:imidazolonepropionase-like amidohydrolase